jgi:hypothetical protein
MIQRDLVSACPIILRTLNTLVIELNRPVRTSEVMEFLGDLPEESDLRGQVYSCLYLMRFGQEVSRGGRAPRDEARAGAEAGAKGLSATPPGGG